MEKKLNYYFIRLSGKKLAKTFYCCVFITTHSLLQERDPSYFDILKK